MASLKNEICFAGGQTTASSRIVNAIRKRDVPTGGSKTRETVKPAQEVTRHHK